MLVINLLLGGLRGLLVGENADELLVSLEFGAVVRWLKADCNVLVA